MKAMMLTAGLGTRLRPITDHWAKPVVPFLGIPLLKYPLYLLQQAGVSELVLNTHYKSEQVDTLAQEISTPELKVHVSHEPGTPLGSGGGIWKAKKWLAAAGESFLVCNGDEVILPRDSKILSRFQEEHTRTNALATILVMRHPLVGTQFGGVWCSPSGDVRGFGKDAKAFGADATGFHYIGMLLLNSRIFDYLPDGESNILYDALAKAIANKETVRIVEGDFTWFETGNPHDLLEATREGLQLLESGQGEDAKALKQITQRFWKMGTKLEKREGALVLRAPQSSIASSASVKGFAVLEEGARVDVNASAENIIAMPSSLITGEKKNQIVLPSP
jgi:mannose-1-phosphate guanylyltransferase